MTNVRDMFHPGEAVMADGRGAIYVGNFGGKHYVHTIAGIVIARAVTPADLGAPRQLEGGVARSKVVRICPTHVAPRLMPDYPHVPLRLIAA